MNSIKKPVKDVTMVYTAVLSRQSWLFNQFKYLGEVRDFLSNHKSPHRNAGFEGAYRILISFAASNKTANAWFELTCVREMPPVERLEKWLEVLLPPTVRPIHGSRVIVPVAAATVAVSTVRVPRKKAIKATKVKGEE
jgi:hypothetical protein